MDKDQMKEVYEEFNDLVNMTASEIEKWLKSEESKAVGWDSGDGESIGHKSGERIIKILHKKKDELSSSDYEHMQKVIGYVKRHLAQKPKGDASDSNWHYSLKNWGHNYKDKK